ncbi:MAG: NADH-quinone oxidoreductase subunit A [Opitutales bacterium]|nr:NADH-quinone oxidoreductase subunit A [Opitutales bacterium]MBQ2721939.1 NADH-quinone oxidoreductase subunit A [Opitutales bacterium]MBR7106198.1 NADH-quinone oxidoreductase subunit A [Opitutales bacterium]
MELSSYIAVLVQIAVALGIGIAIVGASHIFGQRAKRNALKDSAYECGNEPEGTPHPRFGARFYVVAMLFVLFDIEVVFMIPFAMAYPELVSEKLPIVLPALFFIAVLAVGIFYEVKKDVLNWNFPKSN